ncbi:popeye domain-containing protein 1-B-like [Clavelina lepadiformis]|uniref:popeye domain-containing protein 1-B-like n=1 Tax=Clavelina lepadiformis TaxID=159417 RepID=UPI0040423BAE
MNTSCQSPGDCTEWGPLQSIPFHVGAALFAAAFLVPNSFKHYILTTRTVLIGAVIAFIIWGVVDWCTYDVLFWGVVFFIQLLAQLGFVLYSMRHVKFPPELEDLYVDVFQTFDISRQDFKALVNQNCKWVNIFPGDKYAVENYTTVEARVSLLVAGCLRVTYKGTYLHDIKEKQFIDSVEWESTQLRRGELFQVSIEAIDRCFYLCWNREKLQYYLQANPKLHSAFDYMRGKDIIDKVYQTSVNGSRRAQDQSGARDEKIVNAIDIRQGLAVEDPTVIYQQQ